MNATAERLLRAARLFVLAPISCLALSGATPQASAETWLDLSLVSHHFDDRKTDNGGHADWQETNPGVGVEADVTERIGVVAGVYHNSINRTSLYAGGSFKVADIGPITLGAQAMAVSGYTQRDFAALATAEYRASDLRLKVVFAPPIKNVTAGFVGLQIGLRI